MAAPITFDIRGGGGFWAIEFDFSDSSAFNMHGEQFAMVVQAIALQKGLIVMGMTGGANIEGTKGDHIMLSPAYNITKEEVEKIVDILVEAVEEVLQENRV